MSISYVLSLSLSPSCSDRKQEDDDDDDDESESQTLLPARNRNITWLQVLQVVVVLQQHKGPRDQLLSNTG